MDKIKIAIAGLGGISQIMHLPTLLKMNDVEITALCDTNISMAKNISRKHNIHKYYGEIDDLLLENPEINAVIIATRTDAHKEVALKCLEAEKNIFVEKPLARNYREALPVVEEAAKRKKILMVGMNNRFRNDVMIQKSFIRGKEIEDIFYVKTGWLKTHGANQKWFLEREIAGGGVFIDSGIAMLDLGLWMLDFPAVKSVSGLNYYHNTKSVEDSNFTLIKFKNGAALTIEVSWSFIRSKEFYYCNIYGKTGSTSINPLKVMKKIDAKPLDISPKNIKPVTDLKSSYEGEMKHFLNVIRGKDKLISSGTEALEVLKVVEAVYKSAKAGKEIILK